MQTSNPTITQHHLLPVLNTFFEQHDIRECHRKVWDLATAFFSQPDDVQLPREERSGIIFFCSKLDELFQGLHFAWQSWAQSTEDDDQSNRID